jgi:hypothetical protein
VTVLTRQHGIEALLYVEERFRKIASHTLEWTTGHEHFDGFKEVLLDTALTNWEDLVALITDVVKNPERFDVPNVRWCCGSGHSVRIFLKFIKTNEV